MQAVCIASVNCVGTLDPRLAEASVRLQGEGFLSLPTPSLLSVFLSCFKQNEKSKTYEHVMRTAKATLGGSLITSKAYIKKQHFKIYRNLAYSTKSEKAANETK